MKGRGSHRWKKNVDGFNHKVLLAAKGNRRLHCHTQQPPLRGSSLPLYPSWDWLLPPTAD